MKHGSLINHLAAPAAQQFKVGDGATLIYWSDRAAYTVTEVSPSGKTITMQADTATRSDSNGMSDAQAYTYSPNPEGTTRKARLTKNGWKSNGQKVIAGRHHYHDFSF